jgi:hypothetical protein
MADENNPIEILFGDDSLSDLSEDFKTKATVIFENAVATQVVEEKKTLEEEYEAKLEEQRKEIEVGLEDKIDSYLTYIAEEWMKENELAVENGIQTEIAENFLKGMKDLFIESYIEVPKNKVNIVKEMTKELSKKSVSLDEAIDSNIALKKEIEDMKKASIVSECTEGLADTQVDKVNDLVEMIDFDDEEQFSGRVKSIVETYFKKGSLNESDDGDADDKGGDDDKDGKKKKEKTDESMQRYVEAITLSASL